MTIRTETRLFFGRNIPTGGAVSDSQLSEFLTRAVTPVFPGFTLAHASGYWNGEPEGTAILSVLHDGREETFRALDRIALAYRAAFSQESVLVASADVVGTFR